MKIAEMSVIIQSTLRSLRNKLLEAVWSGSQE